MSGRKLVEDDDGIHFLNSFVDLLLVIGLDDNSGLIPYDGKEEESITLEDLFFIQYEPQVLSAASSKVMMHFFPHARQDLDYPRIRRQPKDDYIYKRTAMRSIDNLTQSRFHKTVNVSRHTAPVSVSRHMSIRGTTIKKNKMTTSVPEFPVSEEVIKSITTFCYPDGMKVFPEKRENFVHFLVLTDIMGNKTYATCLTFNRRFIIEKGEKSKIWMNLDTSSDDLEKQQVRCYIPHCCVLISKFPYFTVMKDALSYMVSRMEADPEEMNSHIKDITHTLTMTPIPLAGRLALEVEIEGESLFLYPPEKPDKPVIDIPLHLVFLCFNSNEILKILSAILLEERIVFISSSYALLTTIMQSFLYFILPFEWRYSFVPILTIEALELLEAPGTFMMGCHKIHRKEVEQIEGVVVVDIDEGSVAVNPVIEMTTNQSDSIESLIDIPEIPDEAAKLFSKVCKRALYQHDLVELQRPVCFDIRKRRKMEKLKVQQLNSSITAGCLELMVNLYRNTDMLALTETWLGSAVDKCVLSELIPNGYDIQHGARSDRKGGGVAIVHKSNLIVKRIPQTKKKFTHFELLECSVNEKKSSISPILDLSSSSVNLKKELATMVSYNMLLALRISVDTHSMLLYVGRIVPFLLEYRQLRICKSVTTKAFPR
ncbi:DENN domain-containing protein 3 [Mytilus galloprovincialis]|uniref:DENN domain-containing protein 3 n=1 Tax=Mytilus galloprovincialis TaxID=29158 RepID=A0A8B6EXT8_MYTGA|nr:DENN domain-containing protein 3 [Mytilus galloprovincialis]